MGFFYLYVWVFTVKFHNYRSTARDRYAANFIQNAVKTRHKRSYLLIALTFWRQIFCVLQGPLKVDKTSRLEYWILITDPYNYDPEINALDRWTHTFIYGTLKTFFCRKSRISFHYSSQTDLDSIIRQLDDTVLFVLLRKLHMTAKI